MNQSNYSSKRNGIIAPLFAFLLPVLLILSALAINLAYMQLTTTQLKIATDASSHAGGRALSFLQNTDLAIAEMDRYARLNPVAGQAIAIPQDDEHMQFGQATLRNGKYDFDQHLKADIDAGAGVIVNSVRVLAEVDTPLAFRFRQQNQSFNPTRSSITHQRDRDIALVVDRSGSMLEYTDLPFLDAVLTELRDADQISATELDLTAHNKSLRVYRQYYTNNTLNRMIQLAEQYESDNLELAPRVRRATEYAVAMQNNMVQPKTARDTETSSFAGDSETNTGSQWRNRFDNGMVDAAAVHSRWAALADALDSFFTVLENTDQEEQVALVVFNSTAESESILTSDYDVLRETIAEIVPLNGTQIGEGLQRGLKEVVNYDNSGEPANSRPFAEKMIVVMTDGVGQGLDPVTVAERFKIENPEAVIHAVTFGEGADQETMRAVAAAGGGNDYHANTTGELAEEFREIANIPPTIFTF